MCVSIGPWPDDFERMWSDLAPVGRSATSGGYFRQPFTQPERELADWFREQAAARGLALESDDTGNLVAWWDLAGSGPARRAIADYPARACSPARTSTRCSTAARTTGRWGWSPRWRRSTSCARAGSCRPGRSGSSVFVEEEGSRFGLACLGSRLATGAIVVGAGAGLRDRDGVALEEVVEGGGPGLLADVGTFVELHVEQGRDLVDRGAAVGVASEIWPHGRYRFDFAGEANHAGLTRMEDRADPMLTYAMTALAANKQARLAGAAGDVRPGRGDAQRHQRRAVAGAGLARRAVLLR